MLPGFVFARMKHLCMCIGENLKVFVDARDIGEAIFRGALAVDVLRAL